MKHRWRTTAATLLALVFVSVLGACTSDNGGAIETGTTTTSSTAAPTATTAAPTATTTTAVNR